MKRRPEYNLAVAASGGGVVPGGPAGGDLTGSYPNPLVMQSSGAGATFPFIFSGTTRVSIDAAHGVTTFGRGGTDFYSALGPLIGFEATNTALWLLDNASNPTATNCAMYASAAGLFINGPFAGFTINLTWAGGANLVQWKIENSGATQLVMNSTADPAAGTGPKIYAVGGALKCVGTGGTITTMAAP